MEFTLTLQTPFVTLYKGPVDKVSLRTTLGQMEVLSYHADLAGVIDFSIIKVLSGRHEEVFYARQGTVFMHMKRNKLHVLVGHCEKIEDAQYESIEEYLTQIREILDGTSELTNYEMTRLTGEQFAADKLLRMTRKSSQDSTGTMFGKKFK